MEKDLKDTIELLLYRLIKAGRKQRHAKAIILEYGGKPGNIDFAREALRGACTEAGEVRDELFDSLVLSENRNGAIRNEAFCNEYEIYIQKIWVYDRQSEKYSQEIIETENPKLETYLRKMLAESQKNLDNLKQEIVSHLMASSSM